MYSWANKEKATTATNEKQRKVTPQRNSSNKREEANEGTTATQKATKEHRMGSNRKATNVNQKDSMKRRSNEGTTANEKATKEQRRTNEGTKGTKEARQQKKGIRPGTCEVQESDWAMIQKRIKRFAAISWN